MEQVLYELPVVARDAGLGFLKLFAVGILASGALAALLVSVRHRTGGLRRPSGFWCACSRVLLWLCLTSVGAAASLVWAGTSALNQALTQVDHMALALIDPYVSGLQDEVNTLLGRHQGSRYTLRNLLSDVSGGSTIDAPFAPGMMGDLDGQLITGALGAMGLRVDPDVPLALRRLDLTNIARSGISIFDGLVRRRLDLLLLPLRAALTPLFVFLGLLAIVDKVLCLVVRALTRR